MICNAFACRPGVIGAREEAAIGELMFQSAIGTRKTAERRRMNDKVNEPREVVAQRITSGDMAILEILKQRPMVVGEISERTGRTKKGIQDSLRRLRNEGHVASAVADPRNGMLIWRPA